MNKSIKAILPLLTIFFITVSNVKSQGRLTVAEPTADGEAGYIFRNLHDLNFFKKNNYSVAWPQHSVMKSLFEKAEKNMLDESDFTQLSQTMRKDIFSPADYQIGTKKVEQAAHLVDSAIRIMDTFRGWGFRTFRSYPVLLTLYGPGGSYDDATGQIILFTTPEGRFKGYISPANTLIHEIFHIGIEEAVVKKYNLTHQQKERLVDLFVKTWFGEVLPEYRLQSFGDSRLDKWFSSRGDFINLPERIRQFLESI